jgi:hypothetical protein
MLFLPIPPALITARRRISHSGNLVNANDCRNLPIISRLVSLDQPMALKPGVVFARGLVPGP